MEAATDIHEGRVTKLIEKQTAKIPSGGYLAAAGGAMVISILFEFLSPRKDTGSFVGMWVPTILLLGIYNKLVKLEGHDATSPTYH
jgi:hypothetical protein